MEEKECEEEIESKRMGEIDNREYTMREAESERERGEREREEREREREKEREK